MLNLLYFLFNKIEANDVGVSEFPDDRINYKPHVYNDHIELTNVLVKPDKLIMRSSLSENSMIRWDIPNTNENFSFEILFNEPNLNGEEFISLYLFYTKEKPIVGNFKGGIDKFHGAVAGIEMKGKGVELGFATNEGTSYDGLDGIAIITDAISPQRFKNITELKMKLIFTNKNIKFELYDGNKILYDNFKILDSEEFKNIKKDYNIGLFANYRNVSSGKAIEIKNAQLYKREENSDYDVMKNNMIMIEKKVKKEDILHSNVDVKNYIHSVYDTIHLIEGILGKLPNGILKIVEEELIKEFETVESKLKIIIDKQNIQRKGKSTRLNEIDKKIQMVSKELIKIEYMMENLKENKDIANSYLAKITLAFGMFSIIILLLKEISKFKNAKKL